jgi:hypothetical protein
VALLEPVGRAQALLDPAHMPLTYPLRLAVTRRAPLTS